LVVVVGLLDAAGRTLRRLMGVRSHALDQSVARCRVLGQIGFQYRQGGGAILGCRRFEIAEDVADSTKEAPSILTGFWGLGRCRSLFDVDARHSIEAGHAAVALSRTAGPPTTCRREWHQVRGGRRPSRALSRYQLYSSSDKDPVSGSRVNIHSGIPALILPVSSSTHNPINDCGTQRSPFSSGWVTGSSSPAGATTL